MLCVRNQPTEKMQALGFIAAILTTAAFVPQVLKTWKTKSAEGLSLEMYVIFCTGVLLWLVYGIANRDFPIIAANAVTLVLSAILVYFKLRFRNRHPSHDESRKNPV